MKKRTSILCVFTALVLFWATIVRAGAPLHQTMKNGQLIIQADSVQLLTYQFATIYPPAGVDTVFKRSGFIHPLCTPHGQTLTRIQPPDHYHHYGIWNPWTRVFFEGDTVDFWNLAERLGTVRFGRFLNRTEETDFSEYEVLHEHVVYQKDGSEKIALNEIQKVRVYPPKNNRYRVDLTLTYQCASASPFKILEYRYAGLGWRATEAWSDANSQVLTSAGKTRHDADGSLAKWFMIQGDLGNDTGGMLVCSNPANYNHPEPLRIWPETMHEGNVFAMFAPTKTKDWLLEPGKTYVLKYRFLIFNGLLTGGEAEAAWQAYADSDTTRK